MTTIIDDTRAGTLADLRTILADELALACTDAPDKISAKDLDHVLDLITHWSAQADKAVVDFMGEWTHFLDITRVGIWMLAEGEGQGVYANGREPEDYDEEITLLLNEIVDWCNEMLPERWSTVDLPGLPTRKLVLFRKAAEAVAFKLRWI